MRGVELVEGGVAGTDAALRLLKKAVTVVLESYGRAARQARQRRLSPEELRLLFAGGFPEEGQPLDRVAKDATELLTAHSVLPQRQEQFGHMQAQPAVAGICADLLVSLLNQSMDSWDQAPAATHLELLVLDWFCEAAGLAEASGGVFTSGGTLSNLLALHLATELQLNSLRQPGSGLSKDATRARFRILGSGEDHHSVLEAVQVLGLSDAALVPVQQRMNDSFADDLETSLRQLKPEEIPVAIVATAGTTVRGCCPDLRAVGDVAARHGIWLHVDASHGGACLFSAQNRSLLHGIESATSICIDGHKMLFQPVSSGVLLLSNVEYFRYIAHPVPYFKGHDEWNLVNRSLQTTRRFDALKFFFTAKHLGRQGLASGVDGLINGAREIAVELERSEIVELNEDPQLNIVLFRCRPSLLEDGRVDSFQAQIAKRLAMKRIVGVSLARDKGKNWLRLVVGDPAVRSAEAKRIVVRIEREIRFLLSTTGRDHQEDTT